jgi:putative secretion ATPase (PEP-CTERM system associated)
MLEVHFGFKSPPFQLTPDPSFYFESEGHGKALRYMKFGVHQREGFIVVTGNVGSGKTTLARALLHGLPTDTVTAAHVVSTQVDAYGLLHAICMAFGLRISPSANKAQLLASLHDHFVSLASQWRHALLVVDEAQHLGVNELEELRMLSNFQHDHVALLQSFLVGQPELRATLRAPELEPLRQRVIAACHLGPMRPDEVRAYVIHRLRRVGWRGDLPGITDDAFAQIHARTGGIPRRINILCTRALLGCVVADARTITGSDIQVAADEIAHEV